MIDVGDIERFAKALGRWIYGLRPDLGEEELKAMIQRFAETAPLDFVDKSAFCASVADSYALVAEEERLEREYEAGKNG